MSNEDFDFENMETENKKNKEININDAIIKEETIKELSEEDKTRQNYESAFPEDYVDDTFNVTSFYLDEMRVDPHKEKKNGGTYYSSYCPLFCFDDENKLKMLFFIENFKNYNPSSGELTVRGDNVLARLIGKLKGENNKSNKFIVNYEVLREVVNNTVGFPIMIEEIERGDYVNYTII